MSARARRLLAQGLLAAALAACGAAGPRPEPAARDPWVERVGEDLFRIRWESPPAGRPLRVYAGAAPEAIDRSRPLAELDDPGAPFRLSPAPAQAFFEIAASGEPPRLVAERHLELDGAANFRDLGGYASADGRRVRWGRLYRSDALGGLSEADLERLSGLGIRLVCDFRSAPEREAAPDRLPRAPPPEQAWLPIGGEGFDPAQMQRRILSGDLEGLDLGAILIEGNRSFARDWSEPWAALFQRLADPAQLPALVHCTGGKDRAGFASALVLLALGVPRESVFDDYLLTNYFTWDETEATLRKIRLASLFRTDPEQVRPLLGVRRAYLEAGLAAIDERWGSFEAYLAGPLGVDPERRERLRANLLD